MSEVLRNDRFEIAGCIGMGGLGHVHNGRDRRNNRRLAFKTVVGNVGTPVYLEREFDVLMGLSHHNVVRVVEKFRLNGHLWFAMEKVDGVSIFDALPGPIEGCLDSNGRRAFGQLQDGLDYIHENNIAHAELSPGNLLVDELGVLKIVDFEHCRRLDRDESEYWPEGVFAGTPAYMSPEHISGNITIESDYFVVGILLFEYLSGKKLFPLSNFQAIFVSVANVDSRQLCEAHAEIGDTYKSALVSMLAKDPQQRKEGWASLRLLTRHYAPTTQPVNGEWATPGGKPSVFISHASADKHIARRMALELSKAGVDVWLDEWAIKVGDSISRKIDDALDMCEYVILLLSPMSVNSQWVEKEWRTAFWRETSSGDVVILPALVHSCEIPALLRDKKYVDLSSSFERGIDELTEFLRGEGKCV